MSLKSIAVFCGSSAGHDPMYAQTAARVGKTLAQREIELIYGAGNVGLMGILADAALENRGRVFGVIPEFLKNYEVCHSGLTRLEVTQTMHERKRIMADAADAFVVLPGGFGTMDEFFEILTWRQLHLHDCPIGILNVNGFFDPLLAQIHQMVEAGFVRPENLDLFAVETDFSQLLERMEREAPRQPGGKWVARG